MPSTSEASEQAKRFHIASKWGNLYHEISHSFSSTCEQRNVFFLFIFFIVKIVFHQQQKANDIVQFLLQAFMCCTSDVVSYEVASLKATQHRFSRVLFDYSYPCGKESDGWTYCTKYIFFAASFRSLHSWHQIEMETMKK